MSRAVYLAGPMQGIPHFNFPLFNAVAARLRRAGYTVFNPAEKDIERHGGVDISASNKTGDVAQAIKEHSFSLRDALDEDTTHICKQADGIVLLPGWEHSNGALAEWFTSRALSKVYDWQFIYVHKLEDNLYSIPGIGLVDLTPMQEAAE